jgi:two-component system LytT family response regulator
MDLNSVLKQVRVIQLQPLKKDNAQTPNKLVLKNQGGWEVIPFDEIIRCEADSNYSKIYMTDNKTITTALTLKKLEEKLPVGKFIRVHQSHLVSLKHIRHVNNTTGITLDDQSQIPVSRRKRSELLEALTQK